MQDPSEGGVESISSTCVLTALGLAFTFFGGWDPRDEGRGGRSIRVLRSRLARLRGLEAPAAKTQSRLPEAKQGAEAPLGRQEQRRQPTPAEAAMETSPTMQEADEIPSELASGGHLLVESESGTLFYSPPSRHRPEPGYPAPG